MIKLGLVLRSLVFSVNMMFDIISQRAKHRTCNAPTQHNDGGTHNAAATTAHGICRSHFRLSAAHRVPNMGGSSGSQLSRDAVVACSHLMSET